MPQFLWWNWGNTQPKKEFKLVEDVPFETEDIKSKMNQNEKVALVLPGGGSRGRWQFGAIYWLYQIGVLDRVDIICGTSVGGLNTLLTAKYKKNLEKGLAMWNGITQNTDVYDGMMKFNNLADWLSMAKQVFIDNKGQSILRPKGLYSIIDREFKGLKLKDLACPIVSTTTDMSTAEMVIVDSVMNPDWDCTQMAKLTSAIPIIFPSIPFEWDGKTDIGVDGGVGRNNPVELAIKHGATKIILIGTSPNKVPYKKMNVSIGDTAGRLESAIMHIFEEYAWEQVDTYKLLHEANPQVYPSIEVLDLYPSDEGGVIEYEIDALNFTHTDTLQFGYDHAKRTWTKEVMEKFLLA